MQIAKVSPKAMCRESRVNRKESVKNGTRSKIVESIDRNSTIQMPRDFLFKIWRGLSGSFDGWKAYFRTPILPSSLVFVFLFFNVALSPGGLLTAFLTSRGMSGYEMAIFRGSCAVMGFVGTWQGKRLIGKYGLLKAGNYSLMILVICLLLASTSYALFLTEIPLIVVESSNAWLPLAIFSAAIIASRVGLWSFDMVNAQLFQQYVPENEIAATSSTEMALCYSSELFMLGLAAYVIPLESYTTLVGASVGAAVLGTVLFRLWSRLFQLKK